MNGDPAGNPRRAFSPQSSAARTASATVRATVEVPLVWRTHEPIPATMWSFGGLEDGKEHLAIKVGGSSGDGPPLVRVHSECMTGDVFGSARCDCGKQLAEALEIMQRTGGVILYLRQEGRGIGLYNKMDSYLLQDDGLDTFEANRYLNFDDDLRSYTVAAQMLEAMGITTIRLLSNNPDKHAALAEAGITICEWCPTGVFATAVNRRYLTAKVRHAHHTIDLE